MIIKSSYDFAFKKSFTCHPCCGVCYKNEFRDKKKGFAVQVFVEIKVIEELKHSKKDTLTF